jgi:hypothetical protein
MTTIINHLRNIFTPGANVGAKQRRRNASAPPKYPGILPARISAAPPPPPVTPKCCFRVTRDGRVFYECTPDPRGLSGEKKNVVIKGGMGIFWAGDVAISAPVCQVSSHPSFEWRPSPRTPPPPPPGMDMHCCVEVTPNKAFFRNCNQSIYEGLLVHVADTNEVDGTVLVSWQLPGGGGGNAWFPICDSPGIDTDPGCPVCPPPRECPPPRDCPPPTYCPDPPPCDECPPPEICKPCQTCPPGMLLDTRTGQCVPPPENCRPCQTCPPGMLLNTQTGECVPVPSCPPGMLLDTRTGQCVPPPTCIPKTWTPPPPTGDCDGCPGCCPEICPDGNCGEPTPWRPIPISGPSTEPCCESCANGGPCEGSGGPEHRHPNPRTTYPQYNRWGR